MMRYTVFMMFGFYLFLGLGGRTITFVKEPSVYDMHVLDGRLASYQYLGDIGKCASTCFLEPTCVSFGFTVSTRSCQLFELDVANFTVNIFQQIETEFYKAVCERGDYTHVRALNVCMKIHHQEESFLKAAETCTEEGGKLMQLDTTKKAEYLSSIFSHIHRYGYVYYLGGKKASKDTSLLDYIWMDMTPIDTKSGGLFWDIGEPNPENSCVVIQPVRGFVRMRTMDCSEKQNFICTMQL